MKKNKTKKINVLSYAKIQAVIMALAGLVAGIIYSFGGLLIDALVSAGVIVSNETPGLSQGTILAFGALIGMPLYFAIFGFITGIIGAAMYNMMTPRLRKMKLEIKH